MRELTGEERFVQALIGIAEMTEKTISPNLIALFVKALTPYDLNRCAEAIAKLALKAKPGKGFPSVEDILGEVNPALIAQTDDGDDAALAAARIIEAVELYGGRQPEKAEAYIGALGWAVIGRTWTRFCERLTHKDIPIERAQLRDQIRGMAKRARLGLPVAPSLPEPSSLPPQVRALMLEAGKAMSLDSKGREPDKSSAECEDDW